MNKPSGDPYQVEVRGVRYNSLWRRIFRWLGKRRGGSSPVSPAKTFQGRRDGGMLSHLWRNPWTVWVGLRYLKSKKSSGFLSLITTASILGVGLGVCTMVVVMSVMDGFEDKLKERLVGSELHLLISPTDRLPEFSQGFVPQSTFLKLPAVEKLSQDSRVKALWPVTATEGILRTHDKVSGVVLKGVTQKRLKHLRQQLVEVAEDKILEGVFRDLGHQAPRIFVGRELAYMLDLIPGSVVTLISPKHTVETLASVPRTRKFVVEGVYHSGLPEQELQTVYTRAKSVQSFIRQRGVVSQWEITVHQFDHAPQLAAELSRQLPGYRVRDWVQLNSTLFASLKLERVAMFVVLAFIVIVASFNIVTTLTLMVLEKKKEISIMKAFGTRNSEMAAVFLAEGLLIGVIGVTGGLFLGFVLSFVQHRYGLIQLPDIYYDNILPVSFKPLYYLLTGLVAWAIVLIACLYPSARASRLHPLEGIRGS